MTIADKQLAHKRRESRSSLVASNRCQIFTWMSLRKTRTGKVSRPYEYARDHVSPLCGRMLSHTFYICKVYIQNVLYCGPPNCKENRKLCLEFFKRNKILINKIHVNGRFCTKDKLIRRKCQIWNVWKSHHIDDTHILSPHCASLHVDLDSVGSKMFCYTDCIETDAVVFHVSLHVPYMYTWTQSFCRMCRKHMAERPYVCWCVHLANSLSWSKNYLLVISVVTYFYLVLLFSFR